MVGGWISLSVPLPLSSLSSCVYLSLCFCLCLPDSASLFLFLCLHLSVFQCVCLFLWCSVSLCLFLSVCLYLSFHFPFLVPFLLSLSSNFTFVSFLAFRKGLGPGDPWGIDYYTRWHTAIVSLLRQSLPHGWSPFPIHSNCGPCSFLHMQQTGGRMIAVVVMVLRDHKGSPVLMI